MRAVVQRVQTANVIIQNDSTHPYEKGRIGLGFMVLLGVSDEDQISDVTYIADKLAGLRVFEDENGKMNCCIQEVEGEILLISQFTLYGDCRKGRRPSFIKAAKPDKAIPLYEATIQALQDKGIGVETGEFGSDMAVSLTNDGPVTLLLDSSKQW